MMETYHFCSQVLSGLPLFDYTKCNQTRAIGSAIERVLTFVDLTEGAATELLNHAIALLQNDLPLLKHIILTLSIINVAHCFVLIDEGE